MAKLIIQPHDVEIEVDENMNLLEALREEEIYVRSSCGGYASCSDCIIKVIAGKDNVNEPTFEEKQLLGNVFHITKERLSCQTKISGEVTIDISNHNLKIDRDKIRGKKPVTQKTNVRKKEEIERIQEERQAEYEAKKDDSWHKHWEKQEDPSKPKKMGGGKRPRPFRTDHLEEDPEKNED